MTFSDLAAPAVSGFALGASLIIAIGAQNAFILRQGLLRAHVFVLCLICALSDAVLIAAGVAGLGALVSQTPGLIKTVTLGGKSYPAYGDDGVHLTNDAVKALLFRPLMKIVAPCLDPVER